jgi:hypothetical protein
VVTKPQQVYYRGYVTNDFLSCERHKLRNVINFSVYTMERHGKPYVFLCFHTGHGVFDYKQSGHAPFSDRLLSNVLSYNDDHAL